MAFQYSVFPNHRADDHHMRAGLQPMLLHEALTLSGIADMGPILPMLSNIDAKHHAEIRALALALKQADAGAAMKAA